MPSTMRVVRRAAAVAIAMASAMTLSGCAIITGLQTAGTRGAQGGVQGIDALGQMEVPQNLMPYYQQELRWSSCEGGFECATVKAPMDWEHPDAGQEVELALIRQRATGQRIGSLFTNPGGPGASGYDMVASGNVFDPEITDSYDVIGWDPRGVGRSSAVDCLDDRGMDEWLYPASTGSSSATQNDAQIIAESEESAKWYADQCLANTGPLLEFVDTMSTVRDLDMMRAVVGDPKLNYFGFSYGTDIGAHYINTFPKNAGRMALDGAVDPTLSQFDVIIAQREAFGKSIRAYLEDCLAQGSSCPFRGSVDEAIGEIKRIKESVEKKQIRNYDGRDLTGEVIDTAISAALYAEETWPYLSDAFMGYMRASDPSGFFQLADSYNGRDQNGSYPSNMMEAFVAINCLDYPIITDQAQIIEFNRKLAEVDPLHDPAPETMGDVVCENWPFQSRVENEPLRGAGADPVLVIGTTGDPATPIAWSEALAQQLESGVLIRFEGEGHTAYMQGNTCVSDAVNAYFTDGVVPQDGLRC